MLEYLRRACLLLYFLGDKYTVFWCIFCNLSCQAWHPQSCSPGKPRGLCVIISLTLYTYIYIWYICSLLVVSTESQSRFDRVLSCFMVKMWWHQYRQHPASHHTLRSTKPQRCRLISPTQIGRLIIAICLLSPTVVWLSCLCGRTTSSPSLS